MTRLLLATLAFYKRWLSPALHSLNPGGCRYLPTCSDYAATAIAIHGPLRGSALALTRLLRCHPFARGGLDPVPPASVDKGRLRVAEDCGAASGGDARPFPSKPLP